MKLIQSYFVTLRYVLFTLRMKHLYFIYAEYFKQMKKPKYGNFLYEEKSKSFLPIYNLRLCFFKIKVVKVLRVQLHKHIFFMFE